MVDFGESEPNTEVLRDNNLTEIRLWYDIDRETKEYVDSAGVEQGSVLSPLLLNSVQWCTQVWIWYFKLQWNLGGFGGYILLLTGIHGRDEKPKGNSKQTTGTGKPSAQNANAKRVGICFTLCSDLPIVNWEDQESAVSSGMYERKET